MSLLLVLLACASAPSEDPTEAALRPWPDDPAELNAVCASQPFPELQITCRVQEAAVWAARGAEPEAAAACALIPAGTWRDECHFRLGEELATTGRPIPAVAWCAQAGWFARRCVTHAAWRLRIPLTSTPGANTAGEATGSGPPQRDELLAQGAELLVAVEASLGRHSDPGVAGEGRDAFRAAWGRSVFLGSGRADPELARVEGELGPALRTGWATEAVRLLSLSTLPPEAGALLVDAWHQGRTLEGTPDPDPLPERYPPFRPAPEDEGLPHLPLYGGGLRLVGETIDEDAAIAILHALYGHPATGAEAFAAALLDPRPRLRWTAARLFGLSADESARAAQAAATGDPVVARILSTTPSRDGPPRPTDPR